MTAPVFAFPVVLLEGSPHDRGRRHGERFRHEIAAALAAATDHTPAANFSYNG
jgi:hypothetical protein